MRRQRLIVALSVALFFALTLAGCYYVRRHILGQALRLAFETRDEGQIAALVNSWPSPVNAEVEEDYTVLQWAVWEGRTELVKLCVEKGARVNRVGPPIAGCPWRMTPIQMAVYQHKPEVVDVLIAHGADANLTEGTTVYPALHMAAMDGDEQVMRLLIAGGANVNARDEKGCTPLHAAAEHGQRPSAELLLEYGADVNAKDNDGRTPLWVAHQPAPSGWPSRHEVATVLAGHGAKE